MGWILLILVAVGMVSLWWTSFEEMDVGSTGKLVYWWLLFAISFLSSISHLVSGISVFGTVVSLLTVVLSVIMALILTIKGKNARAQQREYINSGQKAREKDWERTKKNFRLRNIKNAVPGEKGEKICEYLWANSLYDALDGYYCEYHRKSIPKSTYNKCYSGSPWDCQFSD
jgi:hypothetical protein